MACHYPEEVNPGGRDPKIYEEQYPSGGLSVTSYGRDGYALHTMATNEGVWLRGPDGQLVQYGDLHVPAAWTALQEEVDRFDFVAYARSRLGGIRSLSDDIDESVSQDCYRQEASMAVAQLADQERGRVVLSQLNRMSKEGRQELIKQIAAGDENETDPRDLSGEHQNVEDKGVAPSAPAPQSETPDTNDDGSGVVNTSEVPTVVDKGVQAPMDDAEQRDKESLSARAAANLRKQAERAAADRMFAAFNLIDKQIAIGQVQPGDRTKEARRAYDNLSLDEISAKSATLDEVIRHARAKAASAPRTPLVPRQATRAGMTRPASGAVRATASTTDSDDLALRSLAVV
jgi:hypothetical protein